MRHDNWKRRRQGLPPLTLHEKQQIFLEKEKASGYLKKAIMFHKDIIIAVEKYAVVSLNCLDEMSHIEKGITMLSI
ncbi:hypothetical protein THIOM_004253 [Candidatus Thiomargarita nelsonii]|uniref:Uncharacterized protein n=1 Tax=Candidatus Thiomargarita nelsonii TaxID=1003181 RepID=A0A0A6P2B7_9GAMM|nr:hypothetical protein THIOM_004253 [Candidatus Thiomargarita nelsonii]